MIIDRLTTLFDFEIDRKDLNEYKKRMSEISKLTKRLAKNVKVFASDMRRGIKNNTEAQQKFTNKIKNSRIEIRKLEADSQGSHAKRRVANEKLIAVERKKIALSKKLRARLVRTAESHAATARSISRATDKKNLNLKKTNALLFKQRTLWRKLGTNAGSALGKIAHRMSRTASVLIRFRNLLGVSIAGVLGLREVGAIVTEGFDLERARLAVGSFGGKKGETKEEKSKRVEKSMRKIEDIALATPFGLGKAEDVYLDLTRKGIDADKYAQGFINTAAKYGADQDQISRAIKQIGDGFGVNRLTMKDFRTINENKIPMSEALVAVIGDPAKTKLENLGMVSEAITKGEIGIEVLTKVMDWFNEQGKGYEEGQKEMSFFQLDQLQDFKKIFRKRIAKSGFRKELASVIAEINKDLFTSRLDGSFDSAAKDISDFLVRSLKSLYEWTKKTVQKLKDGDFWFQKVTKALGGFGNTIKFVISLGLAAWIAPLLILLGQLAIVIRATGFGFGKFAVLAYLAYTVLSLLINNLDWIMDNKLMIVGAIAAIGAAVLVFSKTVRKAISSKLVWGAFSKGAKKGKVGILGFLGPLGRVAAFILILADNWDIASRTLEKYGKKFKAFISTVTLGLPQIAESVGTGVAVLTTGNSNALEEGKGKMVASGLGAINRFFGGNSTLGLPNNEILRRKTEAEVANNLLVSAQRGNTNSNVTNNNHIETKVMTTSKDTNGIAKGIGALLPEVLDQMNSGVVVN